MNLGPGQEKNIPTYFMGGINARHPIFGHNNSNQIGRAVFDMIGEGKFCHLGTDFKTFITNRTATTPDIILNNNNQIHNIQTRPGKIITTDHLPIIIIKLAATPKHYPINPIMDIKNANWEQLHTELSAYHHENLDNKPSTTINQEMERWISIITTAMEKYIPKKAYKTIPHPVITQEIRELKDTYNRLVNDPHQGYWGPQQRSNFINIQQQLQQAYRTARQTTSENLLRQVEIDKQDPKIFWASIKKIMCNEFKENTYILDENGIKRFEPQD